VRQVDGTALDLDAAVEDTVEPPAEPVILPLEAAAERFPDLVSAHLGSVVSSEDPFVARNEASWRGGAFVYVPRGAVLTAPIALSAIHSAAGTAMHWRTLIVLDEAAEAEVWEQYLSADPHGGGLFNGVVELVVGDGATLRYVCGQGLSDDSWVFASQRAELGRQSQLEWLALGFGSAQGKVRMETRLGGEGSSARVTGVYAGRGHQHIDYDTTQEHAAPHTTSDLAFRGVLADRATSVWRGMIRVDPGAQQTDAFQESRNLLLTPKAHADAIPGLEIEADDVRCTHAAAIAQVDREQLYYLRARGLSHSDATRLIIDGFLQTLVERTSDGPIRQALSGALEWRLEELLGPGERAEAA
jgi:Fe-S cluster assembly protein SufD